MHRFSSVLTHWLESLKISAKFEGRSLKFYGLDICLQISVDQDLRGMV